MPNLIDNAERYVRGDLGGGHGSGLSEDQLEAVFDPFVRLEPSRNRDTGAWDWA